MMILSFNVNVSHIVFFVMKCFYFSHRIKLIVFLKKYNFIIYLVQLLQYRCQLEIKIFNFSLYRDTIDSQRSHRSTSYCDSTSTPIQSSRRSSVAINSTPSQTPQATPHQTPQHYRHSSILSSSSSANNNNTNNNNQNNNLNGYGINTNNFSSPSTASASSAVGMVIPAFSLSKAGGGGGGGFEKKSKSQRYSTPILGFNGILSMERRPKKKEKHLNRAFHSMNETIEVLADPVIEDDALVSENI